MRHFVCKGFQQATLVFKGLKGLGKGFYLGLYLCNVFFSLRRVFLSTGFVDVYSEDKNAVSQHAEKILKVCRFSVC